jgi:hypothetical protein
LKHLPLFLLLIALFSCGSKDNLNDFLSGRSLKSKSEVDPLFEAKTIAQKYGDGKYITKRIKIPLTANTIKSYDLSEILDDSSLDDEETGFFRRTLNRIKLSLYRAGIMIGLKNRIKYSTEFSLKGYPLSMVKSLKVKSVFFTLEDCPEDNKECITKNEKNPITFEFLDTFFLNASVLKESDDRKFMIEEKAIDKKGDFVLDDKGRNVMIRPYAFADLTRGEFRKVSEDAFNHNQKEFDVGLVADEQFYDIPLAKVKINKKDFKDNDDSRDYRGNTTIIIKSNQKKENSITLIKQELEKNKVKTLIKDISLVGENLYVELNEKVEQKRFFEKLNLNESESKKIGIKSIDKCTKYKCIDLSTDDRDLAPMLLKEEMLRFDTYISIKNLEFNDFLYNGYVELELKLDLPL